jgi:hypothetical protein
LTHLCKLVILEKNVFPHLLFVLLLVACHVCSQASLNFCFGYGWLISIDVGKLTEATGRIPAILQFLPLNFCFLLLLIILRVPKSFCGTVLPT